jgi:hypothetical protein
MHRTHVHTPTPLHEGTFGDVLTKCAGWHRFCPHLMVTREDGLKFLKEAADRCLCAHAIPAQEDQAFGGWLRKVDGSTKSFHPLRGHEYFRVNPSGLSGFPRLGARGPVQTSERMQEIADTFSAYLRRRPLDDLRGTRMVQWFLAFSQVSGWVDGTACKMLGACFKSVEHIHRRMVGDVAVALARIMVRPSPVLWTAPARGPWWCRSRWRTSGVGVVGDARVPLPHATLRRSWIGTRHALALTTA